MDREILFRGKREDNGEWLESKSIINYNSSLFSYKEAVMFGDKPMSDGTIRFVRVNPETVGQYTGLTDKNGKKIFEGDILKCHNNPKDLVKVVFGEFGVVDTDTECPVDTVIGWHYEVIPTDELSTVEPFCLSMPLTNSYIKYCHMEVIGNVHDNPDLIKQEE